MLKTLNILIITLLCFQCLAQEHESVLDAPEEWQSEIIPFPLGFAPEIDLIGFEDLRFAPGWSDSTDVNFWTYTFVWYVELGEPMTEGKLTTYFNSYYDGLMKVEFLNRADTANTNPIDRTKTKFTKTKEGFDGKMVVYDNFFTKKYMTLNIKVRESLCPKSNKQIVFCDISRQPYENEVWKLFDEVNLNVKCK